MSIQSEIERINKNIAGTYSAVAEMGGALPEEQVSGNLEAAVRSIPIGGGGVPSGFIGIWSGTTVPTGWVLCDGTNGTPDLRGRFVLGQSNEHAVGETGGSETVRLTTNEMPYHTHPQKLTDPVNGFEYKWAPRIGEENSYYKTLNFDLAPGGYNTLLTGSSGNGNAHENMPPYYVLAYIMKL